MSVQRFQRWLFHHRFVVLGLCIVLWFAAFSLTHIPMPEMPEVPGKDKTLHIVGYTGLAMIFWLTLFAWGRSRWKRIATVAILIPLYGGFDELTQPLVNRHAAWLDWFADLAGTAIALLLCEVVLLIAARRRQGRGVESPSE
ncbi:MAG: VanZ family protein [Phycisphaerae bacterium]